MITVPNSDELKPLENAVPALLQVRNLTKHFGGIAALVNFSLSVNSGEVVGLVGDNGAGKSTFVKILSGIEMPDGGEIYFDGDHVVLRSPHGATAIGIQTVHQDLGLCDNLDTVKNLFLGRELRSSWLAGRRLARATMEDQAQRVLGGLGVRISDLRVPTASLSGGQRQSVAVSRSVLADPRLVLLDEPTAALGVPQRRQVLSLIERLREQGRGVIVISHDLTEIQQVGDRVVVLRLGRKTADFRRGEFSREMLVSAITGMVDNEYDDPELASDE